MPYITFVIPHWLYWGGLIVVPLLGMYMVRKQRGTQVDGIISKRIAYMLWLCCGFVGFHRLYLKNFWGLVYIPIFIILLFFSVQVRNAVDVVSGAKNEVRIAEFDLQRAQKAIDKGRDGARQKMDKAKQALPIAQQNLAETQAAHDKWFLSARITAVIIGVMLLIDAFLLPGMLKKCAAAEARVSKAETVDKMAEFERLGKTEATIDVEIKNPFFLWVD